MRLGLKVLVAIVGVFLVSGVAAAMIAGPLAKIPGNPIPRSGGTSPKVHLVEGVTGSWCTWCGVFDPAAFRLADEWTDSMIFLGYHGPVGSSDPFSSADMIGVQGPFYTVFGYPTTVIDGGGANPTTDNPLYMLGATRWTPESYMWLKTTIQNYADTTSNIAISVTGDLTPTGVTATATITATDPVPQSNLYVKFVLYEDNLFWPQTARPDGARGVAFHANVGRVINEVPLTIAMGQTVTRTTTFIPQPTWNLNNLGVAAFVQSDTRQSFMVTGYGTAYASDVLNAAKHDFTPGGILLYPDTGPTADYGQTYPDLYQEALARAGERFHTFDTDSVLDTGSVNYRDLPTAAELTEAPALIWNTGALTSGTLSPAERTLLRGHLDGGGSLFLTGDGLGFDLNGNDQTFLHNYLHAQYNGDNSGVFTVTGVTGNPMSNAWSSTTLNLVGGSSPDQINTFGPGAQVPFTYTGGQPGSVNAVHDMDSRVVYLGFRYLDGGDSNRYLVLGDVIDWLDGASAPAVSVVYPAGGETLAQGSTVTLKWTAYDVRIPADGVDIYWRDAPSSPWSPVALGEPNDGVYSWTVPSIDSPTCEIRVVARDSSAETPNGAAASNDFNCGAPPLPPFVLTFTSADLGWHFISYPTQESDTTPVTILSTISGAYDIVRWYDAAAVGNHWKSYMPGTASRSLGSLDNTMGFWIHITAACTLTVTGPWPTMPTAVNLVPGWNSVGFPSGLRAYTVANLKADTGATTVQAFDGSAAPYYLMDVPDSTPLAAGIAYWVWVPQATVWNVPV